MLVPLRFLRTLCPSHRLITRYVRPSAIAASITSDVGTSHVRIPAAPSGCCRHLATSAAPTGTSTPTPAPTTDAATPLSPSPQPEYIVNIKGNNIGAVLASTVPVVIDAWADWCEPCKQLMPRLDAIAKQCNGSFILAKLNVDDPDNAPLMKQLPIQSIPTVFGVKQGNIIAQFTGNVEDTKLTQFFDQLFGRPLKQVIDDASVVDSEATEHTNAAQLAYNNAQFLMELNQNGKASEVLNKLIQDAATDKDAEQLLVKSTVALAQCILDEAQQTDNHDTKQQLIEHAVQLLNDLRTNSLRNKSIAAQLNDKTYTDMIAKLSTVQEVTQLGGKSLADLQADVDRHPRDAEKLYHLALYLFSTGQLDDAMAYALNAVKLDKNGPARKLILKMFDQLGQNHPTTIITRRKLSNILY